MVKLHDNYMLKAMKKTYQIPTMLVVHMEPSSLICVSPQATSTTTNSGMIINTTTESEIIRSRGDNDWDDE